MQQVRLDKFDNRDYNPGSMVKRGTWYLASLLFFENGLFPFYGMKRLLLRLFGAAVGSGVVIKPFVKIKYPWFLSVGDFAWIGERVWIDNLAMVTIGSQSCLSQGAYIFCGNHNYTAAEFTLMIKPVTLEEGVWIGAKAVVCPGIHAGKYAVLTAGSVATKNLEANGIYNGNPATMQKTREIVQNEY